MSRSNYDDECNGRDLILWRGAVASAIRGARGQALLREMAAALDAMPEKRLIESAFESPDGVCALGCVGRARQLPMADIDAHEPTQAAKAFGIATALAAEIAYVNDECGVRPTPAERWRIVRTWVREQLKDEAARQS